MTNIIDESCFPNFTNQENFNLFIKDINNNKNVPDEFRIIFREYKKLLERVRKIFEQKKIQIKETFDNTIDNPFKKGFVPFKFPRKNEYISSLGIDFSFKNDFLDLCSESNFGLQLFPYDSNLNCLETYFHEFIHSIDYMLGVLKNDSDNYYSSTIINDDMYITEIPESIFIFFNTFNAYVNQVDHNTHGADLYEYGALMDIMDTYSLGTFFNNYLTKKDVSLSQKVNYGHGINAFLIKIKNTWVHNIPSITAEQVADYFSMKIVSPKAYNLFIAEYPNKKAEYETFLSSILKEIQNL